VPDPALTLPLPSSSIHQLNCVSRARAQATLTTDDAAALEAELDKELEEYS
jgi:hypothetical protein